MFSTLWLLASASTAVIAANANSNGFVKRDFQTEYVKTVSKRDIPDQDLDENITLASRRSLYWLDLDIGTPPQPFRLQLDTGSSNIWVPDRAVPKCEEQDGCPGGSYDENASDTYELILADVFEIQYADGTGDFGDYFTDVVTVGESIIPSGVMSLGLAHRLQDGPQLINDGQGLVGIGYQSNQAGLEYLVNDTYAPPTLIQAMVANGDIDRESYSLYLNDQGNGSGVIIFGGIDSTKYTGDLVALQTLPTDNGISNYSAFNVALTGISIDDEDGIRLLTDSTFSTPALLDSGTTLTYLPPDVFNAISTGFGVSEYYVPCSWASSSAALIYHFGGEGGPSIRVPVSAMIDLNDGSQYDDGTDACYFNVDVETEGSATLGDSFMRSGYFVYDLENNLVAIAQVAANATGEAITAIPTGTELPGVTSTNTLLITNTAAPTQIGPMETASEQPVGASVLPGTPTFALGAAATAPSNSDGSSGGSDSGSDSGSGDGGSEDGAAGLRVGIWTLAVGLAAGAFVL